MSDRHYGNGHLPRCKVRGYTALLPDVPEACAKYAEASGKELCVTHAGAVLLNQATAAAIPIRIIPVFATAYWGQLLNIAVFDTGLQTVVTNGAVVDVQIRGSSQFASQNVPLSGFSAAMPFLGIAWDMADATNPIDLTILVRAVANVDVTVFTTGYGIR